VADQASQGFFSPVLRSARLNAARPWLKGTVLDVGCGSGALAAFVEKDKYTGFDQDHQSIEVARRNFPVHRFCTSLPDNSQYDTVVALALLEHLSDPQKELEKWAGKLAPGGNIVLTTPHKAFRIAHDLGAKIGLFSRGAADEHEEMFDRRGLHKLARQSGLGVVHYERFLAWANQLLVLNAPGRH
jgi:SAM-dependent methyltransferase